MKVKDLPEIPTTLPEHFKQQNLKFKSEVVHGFMQVSMSYIFFLNDLVGAVFL